MRRARIVFSDAAVADVLDQAGWYQQQSGPELASRWEAAVISTLLHILKNPLSGPICNFKISQLAGVRRTAVAGFERHLVFYRFAQKELLVLRIVHGARDLESLF